MVARRHAAFAEEAAEVEVLFASLDKMRSVTKKIQSSMARLDETGRTVQDAIGPIYGTTQRLQTQNTNIDKILAAIERVKQPLDMRNKEERILRNRPERVGLAEYIASIDRTNQALRDLKATNLRSNQVAISELTSLLAVGTANLENVFREMIRQDSAPLEPLKQIMQGIDFPRLAASKSAQLRLINTNISNSASRSGSASDLTSSAKVYALERGQYLTASLANLGSGCIATARKTNPEVMYQPGTCAIQSYATGLQGMYIAEYDNICPVFQREEWGPVMSATCHESLRAFATTLRDLDSHIRNHLITDCYLAYEIIDVVSNTTFQIEDRTGSELKPAMNDALKPIRETAKTSLSMLLADVRTKISQIAALPQDGAGLPITPEVMSRLQLMTSYLPPLSSIMRSLGDGGWQQPSSVSSSASVPTLKSFDVGADGKQLFAHYCMDTIDALLSSLELKAKTLLRGRSLQGVFIANNVAIIERMISTSDLVNILGPAAQGKIETWKKKSTQNYLDAWREPSAYLLDVQYTSKQPRPSSTGQAIDSATILKSLTTKDKDAIKEKFKNFNTAFDELITRHKSLRMEAEVRRGLGKDVQMFIEPLYARFWERYHEVDKGKGKYVKYDKGQLSSILAGLS